MRTMRLLCSCACVLLGCGTLLPAQTAAHTLTATPQHDAQAAVFRGDLSPVSEIFLDFGAHLTQAAAKQRGELWLEVSAQNMASHARMTLRIPLANTGDVYGESRSCTVGADGGDQLTFSAGMDEKNFIEFAAANHDSAFHLLLNKYLCRALAAPFHCGTRTVTLPRDWADWRLGGSTSLRLSADAPAQASFSGAKPVVSGVAFDRARCAVVAPSNGLCCVAHKTTEWHCGGTPAGEGWHQVSGECFHRETGGSCTE